MVKKYSRIIYIVPYFGKLPNFFSTWLKSCEANPTIEWLIVTDDKTEFTHSDNVKFKYCTLLQMKARIQCLFDFEICLESPYKLCDYKPAYGEIFRDEIQEGNYDLWGYCDIDVIWGNIRNFLTEEIISKYDRIGFLGHSTLFHNNKISNGLYRNKLEGKEIYKEIFKTNNNCYFDEDALDRIFEESQLKTYRDIIFGDISPLYWNFRFCHMGKEGVVKNKNRIMTREDGCLYSYSIFYNHIEKEEIMYAHFLRREMIASDNLSNRWLIIPNKILALNIEISVPFIKKYSHNNWVKYWGDFIRRKWKKITPRKILRYVYYRSVADRDNI